LIKEGAASAQEASMYPEAFIVKHALDKINKDLIIDE